VGDPLDVKMFISTEWKLDELHEKKDVDASDENVIAFLHPDGAENSNYKSALIRRFDFTSNLMRMSVICLNKIDN